MKKVYICSALRGDVDENVRKARIYCEFAAREHSVIPIAPHIYFTQFLDDNRPEDREFGLRAGLSLLSECDELWYFGDHISWGMTDEICFAIERGIPIRYIPGQYYEKYFSERINTDEIQL